MLTYDMQMKTSICVNNSDSNNLTLIKQKSKSNMSD
jgi:hypothetical protein